MPNFTEILYGRQEYTEFSSADLRDMQVPDYTYCVLNQSGDLYTPVVDYARVDTCDESPRWPGDAEFAVCLTHDVDNVSKHSVRQTLRSRLRRVQMALRSEQGAYLGGTGHLAAAKSLIGAGLYAVRDAVRNGSDPLHCYERWLEIEAQYDATSTWFVLPEEVQEPHVSDGSYRYDDMVVFEEQQQTVAEMLATVADRGWEIGLHPSWYAYDDADELRRQRNALEDAINSPVESVRQHYLHYDPRLTPQAHDAAGFRFDSTIGFNKNIGFRRGSSYPWHAHDLTANESLELLEVPLVIQDVALFRDRGLNLSRDKALEYIELLAEEVKQTGGVLTLSWHTNAVANEKRFETYKNALELLDRMGAWFGSVKEVSEYWLDNNRHRVATI